MSPKTLIRRSRSNQPHRVVAVPKLNPGRAELVAAGRAHDAARPVRRTVVAGSISHPHLRSDLFAGKRHRDVVRLARGPLGARAARRSQEGPARLPPRDACPGGKRPPPRRPGGRTAPTHRSPPSGSAPLHVPNPLREAPDELGADAPPSHVALSPRSVPLARDPPARSRSARSRRREPSRSPSRAFGNVLSSNVSSQHVNSSTLKVSPRVIDRRRNRIESQRLARATTPRSPLERSQSGRAAALSVPRRPRVTRPHRRAAHGRLRPRAERSVVATAAATRSASNASSVSSHRARDESSLSPPMICAGAFPTKLSAAAPAQTFSSSKASRPRRAARPPQR